MRLVGATVGAMEKLGSVNVELGHELVVKRHLIPAYRPGSSRQEEVHHEWLTSEIAIANFVPQ